jgi:hypothetical protein
MWPRLPSGRWHARSRRSTPGRSSALKSSRKIASARSAVYVMMRCGGSPGAGVSGAPGCKRVSNDDQRVRACGARGQCTARAGVIYVLGRKPPCAPSGMYTRQCRPGRMRRAGGTHGSAVPKARRAIPPASPAPTSPPRRADRARRGNRTQARPCAGVHACISRARGTPSGAAKGGPGRVELDLRARERGEAARAVQRMPRARERERRVGRVGCGIGGGGGVGHGDARGSGRLRARGQGRAAGLHCSRRALHTRRPRITAVLSPSCRARFATEV